MDTRVGMWKRIATGMIDLLVLCVSIDSFSRIFPHYIPLVSEGKVKLFAIWFVCVYVVTMLIGRDFQTVGMYIMRLRVINEDKRLGNVYFVCRYNFYWVLLIVTFPFLVFTKQKRTLYDYMASARWQRIAPESSQVTD